MLLRETDEPEIVEKEKSTSSSKKKGSGGSQKETRKNQNRNHNRISEPLPPLTAEQQREEYCLRYLYLHTCKNSFLNW